MIDLSKAVRITHFAADWKDYQTMSQHDKNSIKTPFSETSLVTTVRKMKWKIIPNDEELDSVPHINKLFDKKFRRIEKLPSTF